MPDRTAQVNYMYGKHFVMYQTKKLSPKTVKCNQLFIGISEILANKLRR